MKINEIFPNNRLEVYRSNLCIRSISVIDLQKSMINRTMALVDDLNEDYRLTKYEVTEW